jgi:hypothetical protein
MKDCAVEFFCEACGVPRSVYIEPLSADDLNGTKKCGDIICVNCRFVIATIFADKPGIYRFVKTEECICPDLPTTKPTKELAELKELLGLVEYEIRCTHLDMSGTDASTYHITDAGAKKIKMRLIALRDSIKEG